MNEYQKTPNKRKIIRGFGHLEKSLNEKDPKSASIVRGLKEEVSDSFKIYESLIETDEITKIRNELGFKIALKKEIARADRENREREKEKEKRADNAKYRRKKDKEKYVFSVIEMDLNSFKSVNDNYSHKIGNDFLRLFADTMHEVIRRDDDTIARVGGDEFWIILPYATMDNAKEKIAEPIRNLYLKKSEELFKKIKPREGRTPVKNLDMAIGITSYPEPSSDLFLIAHDTEEAMYKSKEFSKSRHFEIVMHKQKQ